MPATARSSLLTVANMVGAGAIGFCLAGMVVTAAIVSTENDRVSALTSALAAGDKVINYKGDKELYEVQCTGPGQANAFKIKIDRDGIKVVTTDALAGYPQWPLNRIYAHAVPAGRCNA